MLTRCCAVLLLMLGILALPARAGDSRPAGYIVTYELKGIDAEKGTAVVRDGKELPPKLLMPLYDDDAVFIRDEASRISLSLAQDGNLTVSGKLMRKEITGEMASGDSGFDILGQIADILFGHGDGDSLSVLVAKGGNELNAPMAVRGRNYVLRNAKPLRIIWTGGEGPFTVLVDQGQGGKAVTQEVREIEIPMTNIGGSRFAVIVTDARKRKFRIAFELRNAQPKAPEKVTARDIRGELAAVWLAAQQNGAWRFEAARQLQALPQDQITTDLIAALEKGWLPK